MANARLSLSENNSKVLRSKPDKSIDITNKENCPIPEGQESQVADLAKPSKLPDSPGPALPLTESTAPSIAKAVETFFCSSFLEEIDKTLNTRKPKNSNFQSFSDRNKEQEVLIKALKAIVLESNKRREHFIEGCKRVEGTLQAEAVKEREKADTYLSENEALSADLKAIQNHTAKLTSERDRLQEINQSLVKSAEKHKEKHKQLQAEQERASARVTELTCSLSKEESRGEIGRAEVERLRQQLEVKTQRTAELQVAHREELAKLQQEFEGKADAAGANLLAIKAELRMMEAAKLDLEGKVQAAQVEIATLKGDVQRHRESKEDAVRDGDRCRDQLKDLQQQLQAKGQEMNVHLMQCSREQGISDTKLAQLELEKTTLNAHIAELQEQQASDEKDWREAKEHFREQLAQQAKLAEERLAALNRQKDELERQLQQSADELRAFKLNAGASQESQLTKLCSLQMECDLLKRQMHGTANLAELLTKAEQEVAALHNKLFAGEAVRRQLHNQLQDLKGNVRVFARVRPMGPADGDDTEAIACDAAGTGLTVVTGDGKVTPFAFNQVFGTDTTQEQIFDEVSQLVQSALDGYNVCLFSYGQTGSGKTFTMQGAATGELRGIIPRAIHKVLEEARRLQANGWEYSLEASFLEVYNEQVRDLLGKDRTGPKPVDIKIDPNNATGVCVPGAVRKPIEDRAQIEDLLANAAKNRSVAATKMNADSSRSHSIFRIFLTGVNKNEGLGLRGSLALVDLAGSERLDRSGAEGDRLKETQSINKSLSALSDIFVALSSKQAHVPYRNSKLTHLLSECFGPNGKSLMIVNLSPTQQSAKESLCSLRFASTVNNCVLGRPAKQVTRERSPASEEPQDKKINIPSEKPTPKSSRNDRNDAKRRKT